MAYAKDDIISKKPISGGIEISSQEYEDAFQAKKNGQEVFVRDGVLVILSKEKRTVYSIIDGSPKEIAENDVTHEGYTDDERPSRFHAWLIDEWVFSQPLFNEYLIPAISEYRKEFENTNVVTHGDLTSFCDNESVAGLAECMEYLSGLGGSGTVSWEGAESTVIANFEQLQELSSLVIAQRQLKRKAVDHVLSNHSATTYTDDSWKDDFDNFTEV